MFGNELKKIRKDLGFDSARAFYQDFLTQKSPFDFNYSYYVKIESGKALPSPAVVSSIADILPNEAQARLVKTYCRDLFPKYDFLFQQKEFTALAKSKISIKKDEADLNFTLTKPRYLNEAQLFCLTKSRSHYFLFLIVTLARFPVSLDEIGKRISPKELPQILTDLGTARLAHIDKNHVDSSVKEMKFPKAESESLKKIYKVIDIWNLEFPKLMGFEDSFEKMMLRRISPRYVSLLIAQSQLILDLMRASDEVQQDYNNDVIMLNMTLSKGTLPG